MIDTHVHLNNRDLGRDLDGVIARAEAADVRQFVVVGYDLASSEKAVAQAEADARIFAAVGIHPHDASSYTPEVEERLRAWATNPRVVAIGEIGLDFYRDLSPRPAQYDAFRAQIALARTVSLPIIIHCRDASDETFDLLESEAGDVPVLLHCFAGEHRHAERAWARNWLLGVGGTATYKKNEALREIIRDAPQESLVLETDAPYLTPEPHRGKFPNEPRHIPLVAACIAAVRGETAAEVAAYTDTNARRFFPALVIRQ
jgi:TatD DNase family protein